MKKVWIAVCALLMLAMTGCEQEDVDLAFTVAEALLAEDTAGTGDGEAGSAGEDTAGDGQIVSMETDSTETFTHGFDRMESDGDESEASDPVTVAYGEYYYDVENVVLYLDTYGELPENYITKEEARDLGWEGGSVETYQDGAAIGGDRFGNYEGLLPDGSWIECDIDTEDESSRGAKRLVFSLEDGLYYFTDDHYESFVEVTIDENGEIVWEG